MFSNNTKHHASAFCCSLIFCPKYHSQQGHQNRHPYSLHPHGFLRRRCSVHGGRARPHVARRHQGSDQATRGLSPSARRSYVAQVAAKLTLMLLLVILALPILASRSLSRLKTTLLMRAAYWLCHQDRVSRVPNPGNVTLESVRSLAVLCKADIAYRKDKDTTKVPSRRLRHIYALA
jgi:hypothetical protein